MENLQMRLQHMRPSHRHRQTPRVERVSIWRKAMEYIDHFNREHIIQLVGLGYTIFRKTISVPWSGVELDTHVGGWSDESYHHHQFFHGRMTVTHIPYFDRSTF